MLLIDISHALSFHLSLTIKPRPASIFSHKSRSPHKKWVNPLSLADSVADLQSTTMMFMNSDLDCLVFAKSSEEKATKFLHVKNFMSGAKRGFSDVNLEVSGNWALDGGSEADLGKSSYVLFSLRSGINGVFEKNQIQQSILSPIAQPVEEKKKEHVTGNGAPFC